MSDTPSRQPVFNIPASILGVLALLTAVHALRMSLPETWDDRVLVDLAFVPARLSLLFDPAGVRDRLASLQPSDPMALRRLQIALVFLGDGSTKLWTSLTYALLHGSWTHLGLNGVWLLAFGAPVARRLGTARFLVFLAGAALAGAVAHMLVYPFDLQPLVGASASVSGCMAATLRFMFRPDTPEERVLRGQAPLPTYLRALVPLARMLRDRRAVAFLLAWFVTNLATGIGGAAFGMGDAPIAWQAHIGGFLFGLLGLPLFDPRRRVAGDASRPQNPPPV